MDVQQIINIIVPLIFLILGLFLTGHGLIELYQGQKSKRWSQIIGEVESSDYEVREHQSWDDYSRSHYARVNYKFIVNDIEYQSASIFIGDGGKGRSTDYLSKQRVEKYTPGSIVTVYYDPEHPEKSVLEPGIHLEIFPELGFGILILGFIVAYILQKIGR